MRLEENIDLGWLIYLGFGMLRCLVVRQHGKFHYMTQPSTDQRHDRQRRNDEKLTLLASQGGTVHGPAHHPQNEPDRLLDTNIVFVLLFEKTLGRPTVCADAGCFPSRIVPRRIRMVELEAIVWVISRIEE